MITVQGVPSSYKRRGVFVRMIFGGGAANGGAATWKILLIGQMLTAPITAGSYTVAAGTAALNTAVLPSGEDDANALCGRGSELALMYKRALKAAPAGIEIWIAPSPDATGQATQVLTFANTATGSGLATLEVGDEVYTIAVNAGDTPTVLAARMVAAIHQNPDSRVTATVSAGVLTLSAKNLGPRAAQIRLWRTITSGLGTTMVLTDPAMAGSGLSAEVISGTGVVLGNVFPMKFDAIVVASADATALAALDTHLEEASSPIEQRRQVGIAASVASQGATTTLSQTRNESLLQLLWQYGSRWTTGEIAAAWGAARTLEESGDANAVLVGIEVPGLPPQRDIADLPTGSQISTCLDTGVTPLVPSDGGKVVVERSITCRSLLNGLANYGVLDTNKVRVPFYLADLVQQRLGIEFHRMRIEADPSAQSATEAPPSGTTRPSRIAAAIDGYRREFEGRLIPTGSVDETPTVVEIDPMNTQRVLFELPIDVLEWLVSMAGNARQIG